MARISRARVAAVVAIPVLAGAFTIGTAGTALAADQTVSVPGTPATNPCSVTLHESFGLNQTPTFSESGTCTL